MYHPKGWQRDQRRVPPRRCPSYDGPSIAAHQWQVGHADREIPAFVPSPLADVVDRLVSTFFSVLNVREARVANGRDLPGDAVADALGEHAG